MLKKGLAEEQPEAEFLDVIRTKFLGDSSLIFTVTPSNKLFCPRRPRAAGGFTGLLF